MRGLGNEESFCSCSHGARAHDEPYGCEKSALPLMTRFGRLRTLSVVKDSDVIDEIPMAYKDIDAVMAAQASLVEIVHTLRQVVCVKG